MASFLEDLDIDYPISIRKRSAGTVSARTIDTSGCHEIALLITRGSGTGTLNFALSSHNSATATYAQGTAFGTNPTGALTTESAAHLIVIQNQPALRKFLKVRLSAVSTSLAFGLVVLKMKNRTIPGDSTLGATSLTRSKV
jgi:hypothetical protein